MTPLNISGMNFWMAAFTALAAIGAIYGAMETEHSAQLLERSMRQQQESMLLSQRITTCSQLESLATRMDREAALAEYSLLQLHADTDDWLGQSTKISETFDRFNEARQL